MNFHMGEKVRWNGRRCMVAGGDLLPHRWVRLVDIRRRTWHDLSDHEASRVRKDGGMYPRRFGRRLIAVAR